MQYIKDKLHWWIFILKYRFGFLEEGVDFEIYEELEVRDASEFYEDDYI